MNNNKNQETASTSMTHPYFDYPSICIYFSRLFLSFYCLFISKQAQASVYYYRNDCSEVIIFNLTKAYFACNPALLSIHPFIHSFIRPSIHSSIHLSLHPSIHLSIHPSIHAHSIIPHSNPIINLILWASPSSPLGRISILVPL